MPTPFARPQREPAGFRETPAVLQNNGGTAAGRVGVAVPLSLVRRRWAWPLAASCFAWTTGCRSLRLPDACLPETLTITTTATRDRHGGGGWQRESFGASLTWRFRHSRAADSIPDPKLSNPCLP